MQLMNWPHGTVTGGQISPQADPCGMNFWKKLRNTLERQEPGGPNNLCFFFKDTRKKISS